MQQETIFTEENFLTVNHDTVLRLWNEGIREDWDDKNPDAFTWNDVKDGRSYFIYGRKVLGVTNTGKLRLPGYAYTAVTGKKAEETTFRTLGSITENQGEVLCRCLRRRKKQIFRKLVGEIFGCCNDQPECERLGRCVNSGERLYNGCLYRERMEKQWHTEE